VFREHRRFEAPELDVLSHAVEARTTGLRVAWQVGRNIASDYALLERAMPFVHRMTRSCLTVVLEGSGRFDEAGARAWLDPGSMVVSSQREGGLEAYAGAATSMLVLEWDARVMGAAAVGRFRETRLRSRDRERLSALALALAGNEPERATLAILDVLRSIGLPFGRPSEADLADVTTASERRLSLAIGAQLSQLETHPSLEDVVGELGWTTRHINRRFAALARTYGLPWDHWRAILHQTRLLTAFRLLSAPGATTELVARRTGFRSATALCHAFTKGGLPSPGVLARAARVDVLDAWSEFSARPARAA
jgi:AraC-like DNA-binding protein